MGGKNHQPCGKYHMKSTLLSRHLSSGYAQLELANIELEDIILAELRNESRTIDALVDRLKASKVALEDASRALGDLRNQMNEEAYEDLPPLRTLDLDSIGTDLAERGVVELGAWRMIVQWNRSGGFYTVIARFNDLLDELHESTSLLVEDFLKLSETTRAGELRLVLEENRTGNIKHSFGRLYSNWAKFHQIFLASSLLSTEVWYAFNRYGSLATRGRSRVAV